MFNWIDAARLEAEALVTAASHTAIGEAITSAGSSTAKGLAEVLTGVGKTGTGKFTGNLARSITGFLANVPGLSLTAHAIRHHYCIDQLQADVRDEPYSALRVVQLAEALDAAQRMRFLVRLSNVANPASLVSSLAVQAVTSLGQEEELSAVDKLLRRAYRMIQAKGGPQSAEDWIVMARLYRLAGKPGLASRYAVTAIDVAHAERTALKDEPTLGDAWDEGWEEGGLFDALGNAFVHVLESGMRTGLHVSASFDGDYSGLDDQFIAPLREGMALVAAAWVFRDLGDLTSARAAAQAAIDLDFTCGYEVLAAIDKPETPIVSRVELLDKVERRDRSFYRGRWQGTVRTGVAVGREQLDKLKRLVE